LLSQTAKWQLRAPKSLHRRLAERAAREGVSLGRLAVALLAEGLGHRGVRGDRERCAAASGGELYSTGLTIWGEGPWTSTAHRALVRFLGLVQRGR
jgi:hypothetical protein